MRFVVTGEWTRNQLLKLIIFFFVLYIVLFWMTNFFLFSHKMGFSISGIQTHYLGLEEQYLEPRSIETMLEVTHFHLFAMGFLMLTITHLLLFVPLPGWLKISLIVLSFGSALLNEVSGWLVRFVHPSFAYLKFLSFLLLQLSIPVVLGCTIFALVKNSRSAYLDSDKVTRKRV